jgi:glycosyltransferase involved in cell wall biosynthesis
MSAPLLSVVVIFHNMRREAQRTLLSLSTAYQQGVREADYEVIAIDNGSGQPLDRDMVESFGPHFRYHFHATDAVSPVAALNLGADMAGGRYVALIVDGARMTSPGLVQSTLAALRISQNPFLCSLSWHLGPDVQNRSMLQGYNQQVEDRMLEDVAWPADGYRLFEISTLAQSSLPGFLGGFPPECSWLSLERAAFERMGGYDPGFVSPGGGLVNQDIVTRAAAAGGFDFVVLLGEGVFHQIHGGVATNVKLSDHPIEGFQQEYTRLRGLRYTRPNIENVVYVGAMPAAARRFLAG